MEENKQQLTDANSIAEHVFRLLLSKMQYPNFPPGNVPITLATKVFSKDATWIRQGIIDGWLPIGKAKPSVNGGRTNFYISPKLLWELTGYLWDGRET